MKEFLFIAGLIVAVGLSQTGHADQHASEEYRGSVLKETSDPAAIARYRAMAEKNIKCDVIEDEDDKRTQFEKLSAYKWDRAQMGCGLKYGAELAADQWYDLELQLTVLGAHAEYFDVLNLMYGPHYEGIERTSELAVRWDQTRETGQPIVDRIGFLDWLIPEIELLVATYHLSSIQRETSTEVANEIAATAIPILEQLTTDSPDLLDGLGLHLRGIVLLTLPEFAGGDALLGIELLEKALEIKPDNLAIYGALIEGYLGEREKEKAHEALRVALKINPETQNPQDYVDYMKLLGGFAVRLDQPELAKQFASARNTVLDDHPYLLKRIQKAAFGHGGENPITGVHAGEL